MYYSCVCINFRTLNKVKFVLHYILMLKECAKSYRLSLFFHSFFFLRGGEGGGLYTCCSCGNISFYRKFVIRFVSSGTHRKFLILQFSLYQDKSIVFFFFFLFPNLKYIIGIGFPKRTFSCSKIRSITMYTMRNKFKIRISNAKAPKLVRDSLKEI